MAKSSLIIGVLICLSGCSALSGMSGGAINGWFLFVPVCLVCLLLPKRRL
ncbi:MAG: hypothetical protein AAFN50_05035 [Pseudomonadota bacterium]